MKRPILSQITGFISLLTGIFSLIKSISELELPKQNITIVNPGIWIIVQFFVLIYGNIALSYNMVIYLNKIYKKEPSKNETDLKRGLILLVSFVWIPTYLVWMFFCYFITGDSTILEVFITTGVLVIIPLGCWLIPVAGMLLARVIRTDLPLKLKF
jgi:hypothetical protein